MDAVCLLTQQHLPQALQVRSMETCLGSTLGLSPRPDPPGPTVDPALGPGPIGAVESNPLYHLDHKSLNSQIPLRAEGIGPPSQA